MVAREWTPMIGRVRMDVCDWSLKLWVSRLKSSLSSANEENRMKNYNNKQASTAGAIYLLQYITRSTNIAKKYINHEKAFFLPHSPIQLSYNDLKYIYKQISNDVNDQV